MDRFDTLRVFVRVVERSSFSRAAEDLGLPASTVTDAVKRLEARLKVRLLERTTRHVRATLDGEAYYQRCLSILADIEEADAAFSGAKPKGLLRVGVQGNQARHFILPGLQTFFDDYPDIELALVEGDRYADLVREGIDCVLRTGEPRESDLSSRRIALLREITVASPGYLAQHGMPERWNTLQGQRMVGFRSSVTGGVLPLEFVVDGQVRTVMLPTRLSVDGGETYRTAALHGYGLIQVPRYAVEEQLADGSLVEVLPDTPPSSTPVHVLYPRNRQLSLRVRVFIDWVAHAFAAVTNPVNT
jgi:DNA-binding transcriptional LysR family regulator